MSFSPKTRLQKILMGVTTTPRTAIEHAVKYAVDHAGSGGDSDLPDITPSDNGNFLGVEMGEWALLPQSKEVVHISFNVTVDQSTGDLSGTTSDDFNTTLNNVKALVRVVADVTIPGGIVFEAPLTAKNLTQGSEVLVFGVTNKLDSSHKTTFYQIGWNYEGTVQVVTDELT